MIPWKQTSRNNQARIQSTPLVKPLRASSTTAETPKATNDTAQSVGTKPAFLYDAIHPRWSPAHWQQHVSDQKEWGEEAPDLRSAGKVTPWAGDFMEPGTVHYVGKEL